MSEEQRARVLAWLERREHIAVETRRQLDAVEVVASEGDDVSDVPDDVVREAEDTFYAARGKRRYVTSDGRVLFLTPEEISHRRHVRSRGGRKQRNSRLEFDPLRQRWLWAFNAGVVLAGMVIAWLILR